MSYFPAPRHPGRDTASRRLKGFTLVEVMLAAAFSSGLFLVTLFLLRSGFQASSTWEEAVAPIQRMERGFLQLEQDLEAMQPFFGVPFIGEPDRLEFARLMPLLGEDGQTTPAWIRIVYRIEDGQLVREAFRWQDGDGAPPLSREPVLPLQQGAFSFAMRDEQQQLLWAASWDGVTLWVPRLIKLQAILASADGRAPLALDRVFRHPAGNLPLFTETP